MQDRKGDSEKCTGDTLGAIDRRGDDVNDEVNDELNGGMILVDRKRNGTKDEGAKDGLEKGITQKEMDPMNAMDEDLLNYYERTKMPSDGNYASTSPIGRTPIFAYAYQSHLSR